MWPLSEFESSCLRAEELGHGLFMVRGSGGHPVSFSRVVLSFSLLIEQESWKGEWKYFSEFHHMWFPLQESRVVVAELTGSHFAKGVMWHLPLFISLSFYWKAKELVGYFIFIHIIAFNTSQLSFWYPLLIPSITAGNKSTSLFSAANIWWWHYW